MEYENLQKMVARLPAEITNKILSYTYLPQTSQLCDDIKNYSNTLVEIYEYYYSTYINEWGEQEPEDKNWLINDIYGYMNDSYPICLGYREFFRNVINRSFIYQNWSNRKLENVFENYMKTLNTKKINSEINMIWGLLLPEERNHFIQYYLISINMGGNLLIAEEYEEDWDL